MSERRKVVIVGETFEVNLGCLKKKGKSAAAVLELYECIKVFFSGSEDDKLREASKMLQGAKVSNGEMLFSFPRKTKEKYGLKNVYRVKLDMGAPTRLYGRELRFHLNRA